MKKGYLFISNSTKPTKEKLESRDPIKLNFFSSPCIEAALKLGYEIHMGVNRKFPEQIEAIGYDIKFYNSNTFRNIFAIKDNWRAYRNACQYIEKHPEIETIHCNTPIGGVIGRIVGRKFKKKVIYTAHGFHFFKGAPLFYRTVLKWIEMWMAHYTDILLTINQEDFQAAQKFRLKKGGKVYKIPGVGVDINPYKSDKSRKEILQSIGIPEDSFVCICMGDIVKRKNFRTSIEAIAKTKSKKIHFIACGIGPEMEPLKELSTKLGIHDRVHFLGFRTDIKDLLTASDVFLFSSLQEGLPRSTMEAMAAGLPCIISDIRGNRDLIENGKGGYLLPPTDADGFAKTLDKLIASTEVCKEMRKWNLKRIKTFDINDVKKQILQIYQSIL